MRAAALVLFSLAAASAEAGPWAMGRGKLYAKLGYSHLRSTTLATPDGTQLEIPRFTKDEVLAYAAVGLSDRVTAIVNVPLLMSSNLEDFRRESGFGDVRGGLQVQLGATGPWVFAVRGLVQAPTGDETRAEGLLPTGSGAWEGEGVLGVGRSLSGGRGYAFLELGHNVRGSGLRDSFVYGLQVGWNTSSRVVLAANVRGVEPYDSSARTVAFGSPVGLSDRVTYVSYGPTAIVKLGRGVSAQLDVDGAFRARNLAKGPAFRVGLSYSR